MLSVGCLLDKVCFVARILLNTMQVRKPETGSTNYRNVSLKFVISLLHGSKFYGLGNSKRVSTEQW